MLRIITLLEQKNHFLEKFYSLNESELLKFSAGQFDTLDYFYQSRENLLGIIRDLDLKLNRLHSEIPVQLTSEQRSQIREALAIKDEYVNRILNQDLEILSCIETAKSAIIRELQDVSKTKKAVRGYKSGFRDLQVDEEA